jgi:small subunit ribosomal protein S18
MARASRSGRSTSRRKSKRRSRSHEPAKCRFCRDKINEVDYKDIPTLTKLTTQQGKMFSRKRSGNCARHQRSTAKAVKRARFLGLLPYVG